MKQSSFLIKITPKARDDLESIYQYISDKLHQGNSAKLLMKKIETDIRRLSVYPFSCSYVLDPFLRQKGYRKLVVNNYLVFYLVDEKASQVIIMRILYDKQDFSSKLI